MMSARASGYPTSLNLSIAVSVAPHVGATTEMKTSSGIRSGDSIQVVLVDHPGSGILRAAAFFRSTS